MSDHEQNIKLRIMEKLLEHYGHRKDFYDILTMAEAARSYVEYGHSIAKKPTDWIPTVHEYNPKAMNIAEDAKVSLAEVGYNGKIDFYAAKQKVAAMYDTPTAAPPSEGYSEPEYAAKLKSSAFEERMNKELSNSWQLKK